MKKILLTGATGFVGRQIHRALTQAGHTVVPVIRPGTQARLIEDRGDAAPIVSVDLFAEDASWWSGTCGDIDAVVHSAWFVEPGKYLDSPLNLACVAGTLALAQGAAAAGVGHFVGIGTCMEYRLPSDHLTVDAPLEPKTLYAASKLSVYQMLQRYFADMATAFSWCRLFYLYGEGEYPNRLVPYVRGQLEQGQVAKLSSGTQLRDFLDVREAGASVAQVVETGQEGAINICSGRPTTIRELVEAVADEYGRRDLLEFGTAAIHSADPAAVVGVCNLVRGTSVGETGSGKTA
ncbi:MULTISPECIES: NAD-dependent epimerase/dehydratase family protein [Alphaproteobacteria]|uniref:CDP-4-dehydro-6-deoxy-D-gulose 4-reductase n=2 Tax=Alphaproteobacteria TaxID=28211 RepID=A0A512HDG1_9HYPH|nr:MULTISPECIES: NAD(P)-dependent oxidoreductase [Alphaproteobacteria]GEO83493.1 CDP-4-dehydro-6-deoxy-D-gulose 4-reductase [Ciceribacter naphthalenivorans]GLR24356.1 CDP-4-dehydro-6-deoxy-D-gulose 4-reductase [Ciceribacter naphthalenivorans]GLT07212.1 CDP-4-dehydro-6-deoxy-D-gulose 4-reductase [Sphingomonas psychrolutea]